MDGGNKWEDKRIELEWSSECDSIKYLKHCGVFLIEVISLWSNITYGKRKGRNIKEWIVFVIKLIEIMWKKLSKITKQDSLAWLNEIDSKNDEIGQSIVDGWSQ